LKTQTAHLKSLFKAEQDGEKISASDF